MFSFSCGFLKPQTQIQLLPVMLFKVCLWECSYLCFFFKGSPELCPQVRSFHADLADWTDSDPAASRGRLARWTCFKQHVLIPSTQDHRLSLLFLSLSPSPWALGEALKLGTHGFLTAWTWRGRAQGTRMPETSLKAEYLPVQTLWKLVRRFLRKLKWELLYDPATALLDLYEGNEITTLKRYLLLHVHRSIIHSSQDRETR